MINAYPTAFSSALALAPQSMSDLAEASQGKAPKLGTSTDNSARYAAEAAKRGLPLGAYLTELFR